MKKANAKTLKKFLSSNSQSKKVTRATINEIYKKLKDHNVTKFSNNSKYDKRGDIGFCFGRAFYAHYLLRKEGAVQQDIAKVSAVGRLRYYGQLWEYHMATIVKIDKNEWWAVDTLFTELIRLEKWIKLASMFGVKKEKSQVAIFITGPLSHFYFYH